GTRHHTLDEVISAVNDERIPAGKIYDVADIANDPHYHAREMILDSQLPDGTPVQLPGIVPKLSATPGTVNTCAPTLGQHTDKVLENLGIGTTTRDAWRARGII
ncbi:CoA transferase, partial [Escherichia coli]|nr:CoA transferase [Escherichia coli]